MGTQVGARDAVASLRDTKAGNQRAMPIARLVGNGMDFADAIELHALVDQGLECRSRESARGPQPRARSTGAPARASAECTSGLLLASACYRFGQALLADNDPRKRALYRSMLDAFRRGGELSDPPIERVEAPWRGGRLTGWLLRSGRSTPHPFVVQLCGIGGAREEYEVGSRYLIERGVTALLVDAPGQGETRLFEGLYLDEHVTKAIRAFVDLAALADRHCNGRVGLWGNSAGGWLAALAAADDPRIAAVCMNGGTDRPTEILERFPRFVREMQQMTGRDDPAQARKVIDRMTLGRDRLRKLRCPLHVVHGTPDQVFHVDGARRVYKGATSTDKTMTEYADGDHCVSNRSNEKHMLIADWFADRLTARVSAASNG